jgi:hypothetical protein
MKTKNKAFTLIEVMVIIFIFVIFFGFIFTIGGMFKAGVGGQSNAESSAIESFESYLSTRYPSPRFQVIGSSCASTDTNWDRYISCSATVEDTKNNTIIPVDVECGSFYNDGCRLQRTTIVR